MVIRELIRNVRYELEENAAFEATEMVLHVCGIDKNKLFLHLKDSVSPEQAERVFSMVQRRKDGEPLQYILGFAEFMSLRFAVSRETLIPRADTETLVEYALGKIGNHPIRLLDIGTGTGCIGISMAHYRPETELTLLDVNPDTLRIAGENARDNQVQAELMRMDIMQEIPNGQYDVVVSNPPYIRSDVIPTLQTEVRDHEPLRALDGGADGLDFYRRIVEIAPKILNKNGRLIFEIGFDQGEEVKALMSRSFSEIEVIRDLCGNNRVVSGILKE